MKVLSVPPVVLDQSEKSVKTAERYNELFYLLPFLVMVVGLKLGLALFVWHNGYLEFDADGFTRSVRAWDWHTGATRLEVDAWLPLQFWLNGSLMNFWPDLLHVPRLVNTLCSIGTTLNLFFIGRRLFGRLNGYTTALLAAVFPWEIWFGLSGMSESLTHFFLSFGVLFFCRWLKGSAANPANLVISSLGFLGATMVRYEAWFYSTVYAVIVLYFIWQYRANLSVKTRLKLIAALVPAFLFILVWMYLSWLDPRLKSPLGFARLTSEINANIYGAANNNASFLYRLVFYPQTFLTLMIQLTLPAVISSVLLAIRPLKGVRPYLILVWGEFALFILTTLPYNNIAPGSARYPVSNLLLLLPVVAYLLQLAIQQPRPVVRYVTAFGFAALLISMVLTTTARPTAFPDGATRQVAALLNQRWSEGYIKPGEKVFLILPPVDGPNANDYTRAYYALKVLTNHPDSFEVASDPAQFTAALKRSNGTAPHIWVQVASAGGSIDELRGGYQELKTFGDYSVGDYPIYGIATAQAVNSATQKFDFRATEYRPKEATSVWVTRPDGKIITIGNRPADPQGIVSFTYSINQADLMTGKWSVAITGMETGRRTSTSFNVQAGG